MFDHVAGCPAPERLPSAPAFSSWLYNSAVNVMRATDRTAIGPKSSGSTYVWEYTQSSTADAHAFKAPYVAVLFSFVTMVGADLTMAD